MAQQQTMSTKIKRKNEKPFPGKNLSDFERGFNTGFDKGDKQGRLEGYEYAMTVLLMVLKDKFDPSEDELRYLFKNIDSYHTMVTNGNVNFNDMRKVLHEEYGIYFKFR